MFKQIVGNPTPEEIELMVKEQSVPSKFKSPEDKEYLALIVMEDANMTDNVIDDCLFKQVTSFGGESGLFIIRRGRRRMFEALIDLFNFDAQEEYACNGYISVKHSSVLVEGLSIDQRSVDLYQFIRLCNSEYPDIAIDIDGYLSSTATDEEEKDTNTSSSATGFGSAGTLLE